MTPETEIMKPKERKKMKKKKEACYDKYERRRGGGREGKTQRKERKRIV